MRLTSIVFGIALIAPGFGLRAQDTPPDIRIFPAPSETPKPFDWSRFKLILPQPPAAKAPEPQRIIRMLNRPCAVARITRPSPSIDLLIAPGNRKPGVPVEANSKDITEMNVPAPSCLDVERFAPPTTR
jgi:hypothetical protein